MDRSLAASFTSPVTLAVNPDAVLPAARALQWLRAGVRILRIAPLRIVLLALAPILLEALCQMLPSAGVVLSKLLTPVAAAAMLVLLDRRVRHGGFAPAVALRHWIERLPAVATVALFSTGVFAVQLAVAAVLAGVPNAVALASGAVADLHMTRLQMALVLASGCLPAVALTFVMPRVLFDGLGAVAAMIDNARAVARAWKPVGVIMLLSAVLVGGLVVWPALLLVVLPMGLTVGYAMYRDVFDAPTDR
ncbi:DUF2189 domain-containing protein [Lysobacter humi (ex Lee et al. 2017)]